MDGLKGKRTYLKGQITRIESFVRAIKDDTGIEDLVLRSCRYAVLLNCSQASSRYTEKSSTTQPTIHLDQTPNSTQTASSDFRLPRISIPPFDGNYKEWQSFYDLFGSTVHENLTLSPAQKFQYLKGLLKCEALALVRHFQINDANYIEAYQKLCKRYDKKRYILDSFLQTYFEQPSITQPSSHAIARLHDTCDEVVRGLKALGIQAESRDPWLIYIATQKMDAETRQMWKLEATDIEFPTFDKLLAVLNKRMDALQGCKPEMAKRQPSKPNVQHSKNLHTVSAVTCGFCGKDHKLVECADFLGLEIQQRREYVRKHARCFNCLSDTHMVYQCKSKRKCDLCHRKHNVILHLEVPATKAEVTHCGHANSVANAILPTAQIAVERQSGDWQYCRALLDTGSQTSFVTEECFQRLALKKVNGRILIHGLNDVTSGMSKGLASIRIKFRFNEDSYETTAKVLIVPRITSYQPSIKGLNRSSHLNNIRLADPNFNMEGKINVLLGSDIFFDIICNGKRYLPKTKLVAHNTHLGWVIAGTPIHCEVGNKDAQFNLHLDVDLTLRKFWEIEEIKDVIHYSEEEKCCLEHYQNKVGRAEDGKYIVSLPLKNDLQKLGNSKFMAVKRFSNLEKRFSRDASFKRQYSQFMEE